MGAPNARFASARQARVPMEACSLCGQVPFCSGVPDQGLNGKIRLRGSAILRNVWNDGTHGFARRKCVRPRGHTVPLEDNVVLMSLPIGQPTLQFFSLWPSTRNMTQRPYLD